MVHRFLAGVFISHVKLIAIVCTWLILWTLADARPQGAGAGAGIGGSIGLQLGLSGGIGGGIGGGRQRGSENLEVESEDMEGGGWSPQGGGGGAGYGGPWAQAGGMGNKWMPKIPGMSGENNGAFGAGDWNKFAFGGG